MIPVYDMECLYCLPGCQSCRVLAEGSWAVCSVALLSEGLKHIHGSRMWRGAWFWFTVMVTKPMQLFVTEAAHGPEGEFQRLSVSVRQVRLCWAGDLSALLAQSKPKPRFCCQRFCYLHGQNSIRERLFFLFCYDNQCKELVSSEDFPFKRTKGFCRFGRFPSNKWHLWRHLEMPLIS